ncbi:complex I intermediate-associated protein [Plectosphaerella cucumerina]|uniref:Complex I intermediate-associated protein n=1 Tax=Plectosphaerella cucumerina TaxID=40658 RepID=A0A8K0X2V5_9PEZI|nr:complex I intermediate-associated protein [Plectosphaerella cucumerina]
MRAHLARHVCRRALAARGRGPATSCPLLPTTTNSLRQLPVTRYSPRTEQNRTFFGVLKKEPRKIKAPEYEPGWTVVLTWRNRMLDKVRPPPREELVAGFRRLFSYKKQYNVRVNSTQARHCRNLLYYLIENVDQEPGNGLTIPELRSARDALLKHPKEDTAEHLLFLRALYAEIERQMGAPADGSMRPIDEHDPTPYDFGAHIKALTTYGASEEAHILVREHVEQLRLAKIRITTSKPLWLYVLEGFAEEDREADLVSTAAEARKNGVEMTPQFHELMTTFFATRGRAQETMAWFQKPIMPAGELPTPRTFQEILKFSVNKKQQPWAATVFQALVDRNPTKLYWDVIYQWSVMSLDKGLDDLRDMFEMVQEHNPKDDSLRPDVHTLNALLEVANEKGDAYLAERLMALAAERRIHPNARSYILILELRIKAKDLSGAKEAYRLLSNNAASADEDLPVVNDFLQALCDASKPDLKIIRDVLDELERRIVTLTPATVVALCSVFLKHDQHFDIIDTLSLNIFQHSTDQKRSIREAFVAYCTQPDVSTSRAWDAYSILRQFFLETSVEHRVALMQNFFERKRPDMAIHVFGHMRQHVNRDFHPTPDVYIKCFEGLGNYGDADSLDDVSLVHNMLKMDLKVQPSTRLYNALMLAYAACGKPERALDFWGDIVHSAEGPSYNTLEVVFSVCERMPFGDQKAKEIWKKLESLDIDVPPAVFAAYAGALAGNGDVPAVQDAIRTMQQTVGYAPDKLTLGVAFNALPGAALQNKFADWASKEFREAWAPLQREKARKVAGGVRKYNLGRVLKA